MMKTAIKPKSIRVGLHLDSYLNPQEKGCQVYVRVRINTGTSPYLFLKTGVFVNPVYWDKKLKVIKDIKGSVNAVKKNLQLNEQVIQTRNRIQEIQSRGEEVTERSFREDLEHSKYRNLVDFLSERNENCAERRESTKEKVKSQIKVVQNYDPNISIDGVNARWIESIIEYLQREGNSRSRLRGIKQGLSSVSIIGIIKLLKKELHWAYKKKMIHVYPFEAVETKLKVQSKEPRFLLPEELERFREAFLDERFLNPFYRMKGSNRKIGKSSLHNTLGYFLLSAYTGLRFSDVKGLTNDNIQGDYLVIRTQKTDKVMRIKVNQRIQEVWHATKNRLGLSACVSNHMKQLVAEFDLAPGLVFHSARHTFATEMLRRTGNLKIASISLGHSSIKITERYAHVHDKMMDEAMGLWNEDLETESAMEQAIKLLKKEGSKIPKSLIDQLEGIKSRDRIRKIV